MAFTGFSATITFEPFESAVQDQLHEEALLERLGLPAIVRRSRRQASVTFGPLRYEFNVEYPDGRRTFENIADAQRFLDSLGKHSFSLYQAVSAHAMSKGQARPTAES